eukprot:8529771-Pyramimonas_sp.AAC.1
MSWAKEAFFSTSLYPCIRACHIRRCGDSAASMLPHIKQLVTLVSVLLGSLLAVGLASQVTLTTSSPHLHPATP